MRKKEKESGQIVVILALAIVAIIGITALAIDGSMIYNERRQDQNTADSAALAGAAAAAMYFEDIDPGIELCGETEGAEATELIVAAVRASVAVDGIAAADMPKLNNIGELEAADQGFIVTCPTYGGFGVEYLDILVKVSTEMPTTFARVLSQDTLKTSVLAESVVYPRQPFAYGNGLVSLGLTCSTKAGGIEFGGNSITEITGGGIFSNSCLKAASSSTKVSVSGGADIQYWHDDVCFQCDTADMSPDPIPATTRLREDMIDPPFCPTQDEDNTFSGRYFNGSIDPGWYPDGISTKSDSDILTLNPGLYCIMGDMENNSKSKFNAVGVTLYFLDDDPNTDTNISVTFNQNEAGVVRLSSCPDPKCGADPNFYSVQGLLMFLDPGIDATVKINGGSNNYFTGTIFGPKANFTLNGNTATDTGDLEDDPYEFNTQIVGQWIEVTGRAELTMDLNSEEFPPLDPSLSLVK